MIKLIQNVLTMHAMSNVNFYIFCLKVISTFPIISGTDCDRDKPFISRKISKKRLIIAEPPN